MTPNQNLVIANLAPGLRPRIDALVAEHGLDGHRSASPLRQPALACVALPTCGLAMAEAERYLSDFADPVAVLLPRHGLPGTPNHRRSAELPVGNVLFNNIRSR